MKAYSVVSPCHSQPRVLRPRLVSHSWLSGCSKLKLSNRVPRASASLKLLPITGCCFLSNDWHCTGPRHKVTTSDLLLPSALTLLHLSSPTMEVCCAAGAPVRLNYTPTGQTKELGGVPCYVSGDSMQGTAIIGIYDIFGFSPQFQQVCDKLAAAGHLVVGPDIFRGKPWTMDKFPPKPEDNLLGWIQSYSWEDVVSKDVGAVVAALKAQGITKLATVGWCWGASQAVQAAAADPSSIKATVFLHPSLFGQEKAFVAKLQCPLACFSAPGDPLESIKEVMDATPWGPDCVYRRMDNMIHGYCGARGKFDDREVVQAVSETLTSVARFLDKQLKAA